MSLTLSPPMRGCLARRAWARGAFVLRNLTGGSNRSQRPSLDHLLLRSGAPGAAEGRSKMDEQGRPQGIDPQGVDPQDGTAPSPAPAVRAAGRVRGKRFAVASMLATGLVAGGILAGSHVAGAATNGSSGSSSSAATATASTSQAVRPAGDPAKMAHGPG